MHLALSCKYFCYLIKRLRGLYDNLKGLLGLKRMDRVPNAWIKESCEMTNGVDERIDVVL